jgi:L-ascorbate metabolism protein UlaG (beta-lactamase superfamily)
MKRPWLFLGILIAAASLALVYTAMDDTAGPPNPVMAPEGAVTAPQSPTLEITYVANEGVLLSAGDQQVLIDGLHREYERGYAFLPAAQRELIEQAKAPFDDIDLILPESVGLHLLHNPEATLVSSQQVVEEVEKHFTGYQAIQARVTGATPPLREKVAMKAAGIDFEVLGLGHGSGRHDWVQKHGHLVRLGGKKLLHVGDADTSPEIFEGFDLDEEGVDIAFIPYWFLLGKAGQTIVRDHIKPKHIIALHISPDEAEEAAGRIRRVFPDAVAFTTLLEKRRY